MEIWGAYDYSPNQGVEKLIGKSSFDLKFHHFRYKSISINFSLHSDEPECIALSSDEDEGDDEENEDGTGDKNSASVANGEISEESKDDSSNKETGENAASNARLGEGNFSFKHL